MRYLKCALLFIILFACNKEKLSEQELKQIYEYKGMTMQTLKPLVLKTNEMFYGLYELDAKNTLGTMNNDSKYSLLQIDSKGTVHAQYLCNFPEREVSETFTFPEYNIFFSIRTRAFHVYDMETKTGKLFGPSINSAAEIKGVQLIDYEKRYFLIGLVDHSVKENVGFDVLYDFINDKAIYESEHNDYFLFKVADNTYLKKFSDDKNVKIWYVSDLKGNKLGENDLTKKLTKLQISVFPYSRTIHTGKRIMLGTSELTGTLMYFIIRWDEKFEDVKADPMILQKPEGMFLGDDFYISKDGSWAMSLLTDPNDVLGLPRIVFYHLSNIYPQGISLPIICGYTQEGNPGAFMEHEEWGPCYVEQDPEVKNKLFVYKLNEGLLLLAEQLKK